MAEESLPRFLTLDDVADLLKTSQSQVYAMVRRGDLRAIQIGNRKQWRISESDYQAYVARQYAEAQRLNEIDPRNLPESES